MARWGKGRNTVMRVIYKERPVPVSRGIGASSHHEPPMSLYVGTSGFAYKAWKGSFYPRDLPEKRMLHYYGEHFRAVEIKDRKSTRLNSSHQKISYAVFCLK